MTVDFYALFRPRHRNCASSNHPPINMQTGAPKWNTQELRSRNQSITPQTTTTTTATTTTTTKDNVADNPTKLIKSRTDGALRRHSLVDHRSYFVRIFIAIAVVILFWVRSTVLGWLGGFWLLPRTYQLVGLLFLVFAALHIGPAAGKHGKAYAIFGWNCFIKPFFRRKAPLEIEGDEHQQRLEKFYEGQAEVYDVTRRRWGIQPSTVPKRILN